MLLLASTADLLQVNSSSARNLDIHASWVDNLAGAITPGRTNTQMTTATTTTVVASPAASTFRNVQTLNVRNRDTLTALIQVSHTDGTTGVVLFSGVLLPGDQLTFMDGVGFQLTSSLEIDNRVRLASDFTNATTTPNVVTALTKELRVGTWAFRYALVYRSSAIGTGIKPDVNFTGSRNFMVFNFRWVDTSGAQSTSPDQDLIIAAGGIMSAWARRAPNTVGIAGIGVDSANDDMFLLCEGLVDVSAVGNLELYIGAETVGTITLLGGSTLWLEPYGS